MDTLTSVILIDIILREFGWPNDDHDNSKHYESKMQQTILTHPVADFAALFIICIVLGICVLLSTKPDKDEEEECLSIDESNRIHLPEDRPYKLPPTLNAGHFCTASGDASNKSDPMFTPVYAEEPKYPTSRISPIESCLDTVHYAYSQSTQTSNRTLRRAANAHDWLVRRTRSGHIYGKYPM